MSEGQARKDKPLPAAEAILLVEQLLNDLMQCWYRDALVREVLPALRALPPDELVEDSFFRRPSREVSAYGLDLHGAIVGANEQVKRRLAKQGREMDVTARVQEWLGYKILDYIEL